MLSPCVQQGAGLAGSRRVGALTGRAADPPGWASQEYRTRGPTGESLPDGAEMELDPRAPDTHA